MIRNKRAEGKRASQRFGLLRTLRPGRLSCAAVALMMTASLAFGQGATGGTKLTLADGEAAQIRSKIIEIMGATDFIATRQGALDAAATAAYARESFLTMADEEMELFAGQLPALTRLAGLLDSLALEYGSAERAGDGAATSVPGAATSGLPSAGYSGPCPSPRRSTSSMKSLLTGVQIAEGIANVARRVCDQLVAGFNVSLACLISDTAWLAVKAVFEQFTFCVEDIDSAEILGSFERTLHIHGDLDLARTANFPSEATLNSSLLDNRNLITAARATITLAIQTGLQAIIDAIHEMGKDIQDLLNAEFDCQNTELRTWRMTSLRTLVEEDLGRGLNVDRIASFQLPASIVCTGAIANVPCGSLETVEAVVKDIIGAMKDAGLDTFDADTFLQKGRHTFALGDYKIAYQHFTTAYRLATGLVMPPFGGCCRADGACKDSVLEKNCFGVGEVWHEELLCVEISPPCLSGACCREDGTCTDAVLEDECAGFGDVWNDGMTCFALDPTCGSGGRSSPGVGDTSSGESRQIGGRK